MKKMYFFFALVTVTACDICDTDPEPAPDTSRYVGTFKISAWNAPVPVDIDQNGIASRNLLTECVCYQPSKIILSANRNYVKHDYYAEVQSAAISCASAITTGIWDVEGNRVRLLSSDGGTEVYNYGEVNEVLTRSESNWIYPIVADGEGAYAQGDVNMIFTKE